MRQTEAAQKPPDRDAVGLDAVAVRQLRNQIVQGQIRLLGHPSCDAVLHGPELAMTAAIALRPRFKPAGFTLQDDHIIDKLHRNPEPDRRRPM